MIQLAQCLSLIIIVVCLPRDRGYIRRTASNHHIAGSTFLQSIYSTCSGAGASLACQEECWLATSFPTDTIHDLRTPTYLQQPLWRALRRLTGCAAQPRIMAQPHACHVSFKVSPRSQRPNQRRLEATAINERGRTRAAIIRSR